MRRKILTLSFLAFGLCQVTAQIEHVEPLNWWVGMNSPELQLMVEGPGVGKTKPVIRYSGISLIKYTPGDSENYLFIDLRIGKPAKPGVMKISFEAQGKEVYNYDYPLLAREQSADKYKGFSSADVIYLITPDRFANSNPGNDVVEGMKEGTVNRKFQGGRHGGDIQGITDHLDYIANMGFTAIWPGPMLENNMEEYSYHGYSITDHYKVDPRFGTLDDYKALAKGCKERGLKLIFDGVINHIGSEHRWMKDLPFKDWINFAESPEYTHHRRTTNQDIYASQYDKDMMTKGWFVPTMPDMNGKNPFLANYLIQNSIWWIETLQLGGIRQDTYCYSDKYFSADWSCRIMKEYPDFNIVGEEWSYNPLITSYWQQGKVNHDGYTGCLKTTMDFPMQTALSQALKEDDRGDGKGMTRLYEALANDFVYADPHRLMVFGDNHDMDRIFTQLNQDPELTRMAITYLLTVRGIPQFYYGTEVLMDNAPHLNDHGYIRADFPGGWSDDAVNLFSGKGITDAQAQMQGYMKKLLNWRKTSDAVIKGKTLHFAPFDQVYVYFRYTDTQKVMVILNRNPSKVEIDLSRFREFLKPGTSGTDVMSGQKYMLQDKLVAAPRSATVLELK